jgi:hypothetical protein
MLYQLSYSRLTLFFRVRSSSQPSSATRLLRSHGEGRIRTSEGNRRQIYSLLPLATRVPLRTQRADGQTRTGNLLITSQLLFRLSYIGLLSGNFRQER